MNIYHAICKKTCFKNDCFCGLPIILMEHVQLPCCNDSIHHVNCIMNESSCPNCKRKFDKQTLNYIQNVNEKVIQKQIKQQIEKKAREPKQKMLRKQIKETVQWIIQKKLN